MVRRFIKLQNFIFRGTLLALFIHSQGHLLADPTPQFPEIGLEQANERITGSFKPARLHDKVRVRGVATGRALVFPASHLLPIQNEAGRGLFLEDSGDLIDGVQPGDRLEVSGSISERDGIPVLSVLSIAKIGTLLVPAPRSVPLTEVNGFTWLGSLVMTEGKVRSTGSVSAGSFVDIEDKGQVVRVYLPAAGPSGNSWKLSPGDKVRVIGYASQYCPDPHHNRFFQIIVDDASRLIPMERLWVVDPTALFGLLGLLAAVLAIWCMLERHWTRHRRTIRALNGLGEELLLAKSHAEALKRLQAGLPRILKGSSFRIFFFNKSSQTLDCWAGQLTLEESSGSTELTVGRESPLAGAVFAFRNKTLLTIPDTRHSPLLSQEAAAQLPTSIIYIPMVCAGEPLGVLEISYAKRNYNYKLSRDIQVSSQHLGNQAAIALQLLHQREVKDQLVHSEKLSATGQLMAGIADEITAPLQSISQLSSSLLRHRLDSLTERTVRAMGTHAGRATDIVARLTSLSSTASETLGEVDLASMIRILLAQRDLNTKSRGIRVDTNLADQSVMVTGNRKQLEQVFLSLLVHAERQQNETLPAGILVGLSTASRSVLVRIEYSASDAELVESKEDSGLEPLDAQEEVTFNLDFCRGILNAHDGNIHLVRNNAAVSTFEVELPLAETSRRKAEQTEEKQKWTVLVIEPDGAIQRKILATVSTHGHRVIPVVSAEEASDLMDRLRFDLVFCSVRLPGRTWRDFYESIRHRPITFILVTEGIDEGLSRVFEGSKGFLLRKPLADQDLEQLLRKIRSAAGPIGNGDRDTPQPVTIT